VEPVLRNPSTICTPVRATADASIQGFELRSAGGDPQSFDALAPALAQHVQARQAHLWLRICGADLRSAALAGQLAEAVVHGGWSRSTLTLALAPGDAGFDLQRTVDFLGLARECRVRSAICDVELEDLERWEPLLHRRQIDELRLSGRSTAETALRSLELVVSGCRRHPVRLTGLDIDTLAQCDAAVVSGLHLMQGRIVGAAFPLCRLHAMLDMHRMPPTAHGLGNEARSEPARAGSRS
jgi:hypothetical protein